MYSMLLADQGQRGRESEIVGGVLAILFSAYIMGICQ
jgi:hypothetical protein